MKPLRLLLLDVRSALRRADPVFEASTLRERLDDAIIELSQAAEAKLAVPEIAAPETYAAQQVAYAWQVAARDLRFTHPELHAQLGERVRKLLDAETLDDPALEIHRLASEAAAAHASADATRRDLDELRQALADAVPGIDAKVPPPKPRACACACSSTPARAAAACRRLRIGWWPSHMTSRPPRGLARRSRRPPHPVARRTRVVRDRSDGVAGLPQDAGAVARRRRAGARAHPAGRAADLTQA
jgi:hypothetical protein